MGDAEALEAKFDKAAEVEDARPEEAVMLLTAIVEEVLASGIESEEVGKVAERAVYSLTKLHAKNGSYVELAKVSRKIRPLFASFAKAKTAKIVRSIIDMVAAMPGEEPRQTLITLCSESIDWCKEEKRSFLRQRIEFRLASLYLDALDYAAATKIISPLLREVKRIDDKALLVEIQLLESRVQHAIRNVPKARASLTSARTTANAIYVPPILQAEIDMMAGVLHAEEKDYKTAYSYFFEGFEGFNSMEDARAVANLKYMLLCKIMTNNSDDVQSIVKNKTALKYVGEDVDAMRAVAAAHKKRSLTEFEEVMQSFTAQLSDDPIIKNHLEDLYDNLLEQNLCRLMEPFSRVEIAHLAELIKLPVSVVEPKLSQMILDKKFQGILDQGAGCLIVFDETPEDKIYPPLLETVSSMGTVVDSLFEKANQGLA